jgi:hypothetical protein
MSVRAERHRKRSLQKREAARAAAAQMLAREHDQRESLDDLLAKSLAVGRHLEIDKQLKELGTAGTLLTDRFRGSFKAFEEALNQILVARLGQLVASAPPTAECHTDESSAIRIADRLLRDAEDAFAQSGDVFVEMARLLVERADLNLGGITRDDVVTRIHDIAARADDIEAGLEKNRRLVDELLSDQEG